MADRTELAADGKDLSYITVRVVDKDGNLCPFDNREVSFRVSGQGTFRAAANGDATCIYPFHKPLMPAFSGQLTVLVQSGTKAGNIIVEARAKGVKTATLPLKTN